MQFGLFGSAAARRGGPGIRQQRRVSRFHRIQHRGRGARISQHLCRRAPFHRLWPGLGDAQPVDLARRAHPLAAARHGGDRTALAQPGAAGRAGGDPRSALRGPARFRHRQGLPLQRVRRILRADGRGRRAVRRSPRRHRQGMDRRTSRFRIAADTGSSTISSSSRRPRRSPHPPIWMGAGGERSVRRVAQQGYNLLLGQYASPEDVGRSIAAYRDAVEASGRRFDPMQVGVTRAFFVPTTRPKRKPRWSGACKTACAS